MAALPLFLSADTIRNELAARIEAATGRTTRIDGPVSFSVFPTARLSAEGIGIAGLSSDGEAFSVESVSFGLSLLPLITGNIEIYGITITRPSILIEADESGRSTAEAQPDSAPASIEDMIGGAPTESAPAESAPSDTIAVLDRLSIGRVTIADGTLVWRDKASGREERIDSADLDIRVPELDGAGTVEGTFSRLGTTHSLKLEIGERPDPSRFESVPIAMTLSSDAATVTAAGTALAGDKFFSGTVDTKGSSLSAFAKGLGVELPAAPAFGEFQTSARVEADASQILIERFAVDLGGIKAKGGAAIGLDRARPGIGLKIEAERVDTALFIPQGSGKSAAESAPEATGAPTGDDRLDLSALGLVDANIDFSAAELLIGAVPITNLGMDVQVVGGGLNATIRSATVNGAPGSGTLVVDNSGQEPSITGNIKMNGLDAGGLVALSGAGLPVDAGGVGLDVAFATHGATKDALIANLDGRGQVSLLNGHLKGLGIADKVGGDATADEIDDVDIVAEFSSLTAPVTAKGGFSWRGERFDISARGEPRALATGSSSPVTLGASSRRVNLGFNGEASAAGLGSGSVKVSGPSLRDFLAWIGQPMSPGGGLGAFAIEGAINLASDSFSFDQTAFSLDGSKGTGNGKLIFGEPLNLTAELAMTTLDVTPYLVASGAAKGGGSTGGTPSKGGGWSTDRIAFDGLRAIDANLNFKAEQVVSDKIKFGPANVIVTIEGGKLSAELAEMALYSGGGAGTLKIDGAAQTPSVRASFRLLEISALPFLTDVLGFSRIEGRGSFAFDLSASGASEAALVAALDGNGTVYVRDGAIRGIDIPKMVRTLSVETLLGWQQGSGEKTDFTELSGSFAIDKGILTNDDLSITGPLLRVTGAGKVDIPNRTLAYRVDPKVVASLEGQGGSGDLEGFAVPVRVEGSWDRPRIYPEIEGILQNPQQALDQLRKLGGGLFGSASGSKPSDGGSGKSAQDKLMDEAAKGLDQLLGGSRNKLAPQVEAPTPVAPSEAPPAPAASTEAPAVPPDQPPATVQNPETPPETTTGSTPPEAPVSEPPPEAAAPEGPPAPDQQATDQPVDAQPKATPPADGAPPADGTTPAPADPAADLLKSLLGQ